MPDDPDVLPDMDWLPLTQSLGMIMATCFAVCATVLWLASLPLRRLVQGTHWTELARLFFPLRIAVVASVSWTASVAAAWMGIRMDWDKGLTLAALLAGLLGGRAGARLAFAGLKLPPQLKHPGLRSLLLRLMMFSMAPFLLVEFVWTAGHKVDSTVLAVVGGGLLVGAAWCKGLCVWVCRGLGWVRPAPERVRALVEKVSHRMLIPCHRAYELRVPVVNAAAIVWTHELAVTTGALDLLTEEELESVIAHELAHLNEPPPCAKRGFWACSCPASPPCSCQS